MAEEYLLDDKYTSGVWYDQMNGDYCKIQRGFDPDAGESGRLVELVNPENDNVYWDMPVSEWVESEQQDFRQVSDEAVDDPKSIIIEVLELTSTGEKLSMRGQVDLRYALQQVEIVEK